MTDSTGLLQHAEFGVPRYEDGYCLDDNARALIVMTLCEYAGTEDPRTLRLLTSRYSGFIRYAWNPKLGRFRNFMSYQREWQEEYGSEDSHGRALWALGTAVGRASDAGQRSLCGELFHAALPALTMFTSPRGWAYALLGIEEYLGAFQGDSAVESVMVILAERLLAIYKRTNEPEWPWFEDRLTYCNARLPQALLLSGARMNRKDMIETSIGSLQWLVSVQTSADGYFAPVGSKGFYRKAGSLARFDQQPIDALATISACLSAQRVTREEFWAVHARVAFDWYLGQNCLQQIIYDAATGGCRDGLEIDRVNQNQGAESTLSFLLSVLELRTQDRVVEQVGFRPAKRYSNTCDS